MRKPRQRRRNSTKGLAVADENKAEVGVSVQTDQASKAVADLQDKFKEFSSHAKEGFEGLSGVTEGLHGAVEKIAGAFAAVTAVLAGGKLFSEAISETTSMTKEVNKLSIVLGVSRADAMALATGLEMIGSSSEAYIGTVQRLTMKLKSGEDGFNAVGIATRDSNGELLNGQEVMQNTIKHLDGMKAGTDRNLEATSLLGRNWASSLIFGRLNGEMLEEIKKKQEALNMAITGESVEAMYKYMGAMTESKEVFKAVALSAGQTMMPRLTEMAEWFASTGPAVVRVFNETLATYLLIQDTVKESVLGLIGAMVDGFKEIGKAVGLAFGEDGPTMQTFDYFLLALKAIQTGVIYLRAGIETAFEIIKGVIEASINVILGYARVAEQALIPGNNYAQRVKRAWSVATEGVEDAIKKTAGNTLAIAQKMQKDISNVFEVPMPTPKEEAKGGGGKYDANKGKPSTFVADAQAELKLLTAEEDVYHEHSKRTEAEFWANKLSLVKNGTDEYTQTYIILREAQKAMVKEEEAEDKKALEAKIAAAHLHKDQQLQLASDHAAEMLATYKEDSNHYRDALKEKTKYQEAFNKEVDELNKIYAEREKERQLSSLDADQEMVKYRRDIGMIDAVQQVKETNQLEDQKYRIKIAALQKESELENISEKDRQERINKLKAMEQNYDNWRIKAGHEVNVSIEKEWETVLSPISSAFSTTIKGMLSGTQTLRNGLRNAFGSILGSFLDMVVTMGTKWAAMQAFMLLTTEKGSAERAALESSSTLMSIIKAKLQALGLISTSASTGAAAAAASTAAIPIVGPELAPAAGAAMYAEIMGFSAGLASAKGGYDIPAGVNPVTQLHQREMVLPEKQADVIRGLAGGEGKDVHFHVHAIDAAGVRKFFLDNTGAMTDSLRRAARNFVPVSPS